MFLIACIFSGCDYLDSVKGVGLKKAVKLVSDHPDDTVQECFKALKGDLKVEWPRKFERKFLKAFLTFKFQRVWCPDQEKMVHIELPNESVHGQELKDMKKDDFLGAEMQHEIVKGVAIGIIDPITFDPFPVTDQEFQIVANVTNKKMHNFKSADSKFTKSKKNGNLKAS